MNQSHIYVYTENKFKLSNKKGYFNYERIFLKILESDYTNGRTYTHLLKNFQLKLKI